MKKQVYIQLPLQEPLINCITQDAYLQSIVLCNGGAYPWLMSQFVQVWACDPKIAAGGVFIYFVAPSYWFACPHLYTQEISKETVNVRYDSIVDFLTDSLSLNNYVILPVNRRFIKAYQYEGEGTHDLLIHGYDSTKELFYIADFFEGRFNMRTCSFQEVEDAYFTDKHNPFSWHNTVRLAVQDEHRLHYDFHLAAFHDFDTRVIAEQLSDYIMGDNSIYRYRICQKNNDSYGHTVGGVRVYDVLLSYAKERLDQEASLDHRVFYNIWAHKHMMTLRAKFMKDNGIGHDVEAFLASFEEIEKKARLLLNRVLKDNIKRGSLLYPELETVVTELRAQETQVIRDFIEIL